MKRKRMGYMVAVEGSRFSIKPPGPPRVRFFRDKGEALAWAAFQRSIGFKTGFYRKPGLGAASKSSLEAINKWSDRQSNRRTEREIHKAMKRTRIRSSR